ncbi:MAG TPA: universal stress protein [Polyangiaceae bacterium]
MAVFERILVATDFESSAERALDVAVRLASEGNAELTVLHVYAMPVVLPSADGVTVVDALPEVRAIGQQRLDELVARTRARYARVTSSLRAGDPKTEILEVAKNSKADLLVLGTEGRRGLARMFLGSVAEYVVRNSTVPVLTIRVPQD